MDDPFLKLERPHRRSLAVPAPDNSQESGAGHSQRKHSKFSASGSERWHNCPGSVELSEGLPDKSSPWAEEGTRAHELLEATLKSFMGLTIKLPVGATVEMATHARSAANFILNIAAKGSQEILIETRISLEFIHKDMFGTFDGAVIDHFGTLHVFDYKYGAGYFVSPKENLQMIFYGLGLAHRYHYNFKKVRLWIIQPRVKGYDGPLFWDLSISDLKVYEGVFRTAVERVERFPKTYQEGQWCHWCKAKSICPLKLNKKMQSAKSIFTTIPFKSNKWYIRSKHQTNKETPK